MGARGKSCSINHAISPNQKWQNLEQTLGSQIARLTASQDHKHLLNIQTDANEISQAQGSIATVDNNNNRMDITPVSGQNEPKLPDQLERKTCSNTSNRNQDSKLNSTSHFQNQALVEGLKPGSSIEEYPSRNKRQVYSKESNKVQLPQLPQETDNNGISEADQSPQAKIDPNPINTFKMEKIEHFNNIPSTSFDVTQSTKVHYRIFETKQEYIDEIQRLNPNIVLDYDESVGTALSDILSNQKELIQKDGNIMLKGILIKGAPSLGTKFNPNFRDPHHAPGGSRPKSRGLTQGNIIQIASKALAVISSQGSSPTQNYQSLQNTITAGKNQKRRENKTTDLKKQNSLESTTEQESLLMQGFKKQTIRKKTVDQMRIRNNEFQAKSLQSMSSGHTRMFHEKKMTKIQGGGEHGHDKVQLNVKFDQNRNGKLVISQYASAYGNSNFSPNASPMRMINKQNKTKSIVSNDSHQYMSDGQKRTCIQFGKVVGENNSSAADETGKWKMKHRLEVTGNQSPQPELQHNHKGYSRKTKGKNIKLVNQSLTDSEQSRPRNIKSPIISDATPTLKNYYSPIDPNMRRSEAIESPCTESFQEKPSKKVSVSNMRIDLKQLQADEDNSRNVMMNEITSKTQEQESSMAKLPKKGSFERMHTLHMQNQNQNQNNKNLAISKKRSNKLKTKLSNRSATPLKHNQVRKGQPIKDFNKQIQNLGQDDQSYMLYKANNMTPKIANKSYNKSKSQFKRQNSQSDIKVMGLNGVDFEQFEKTIGQKNPVMYNRQENLEQVHEMRISNRQLNSAISDDKIKTEQIAENTVSPENTQRQDFAQNFSNINIVNDINFQNYSIGNKQLKTVRVVKSPSNRLIRENKLSYPLGQGTEADKKASRIDRHTKSGNAISSTSPMDPRSSKRVILTQKKVSNLSSRDDSKTVIIEVQRDSTLKKKDNDYETQEEMMKPKGINIFQHDLMKSENDSFPGKEYIKYEDSMVQNEQYLLTILNQNKIDEYVTEENQTENQGVYHGQKQQFKTGEGSMIEPKTSFFTSSLMKGETPDMIIDSQRSSGQEKFVVQDRSYLKKTNTLNPKKRQKQIALENKTKGLISTGQGEIGMVDIDHIHYTEISSNANSINKSEIIKQMVEKYEFQNIQHQTGTSNSIPLNNQDVIARSKKVPQISQINYKSSNKPNKNISVDQKSDLNSRDKRNDTVFINYDEQTKRKLNSSIRRLDSGENTVKIPIDMRLESGENTAKLPRDIQSKSFNLNLQGVSKDDASREINISGFNINIGQPVSTGRDQTVNMLTHKNSKFMSKIISESLLDCRDIGIGTSAINGEEIDNFLKSSNDMLKAAIADANVYIQNSEQFAAAGDYKPIHQVNVQLLTEKQKQAQKSFPTGNISRHKSSRVENKSVYDNNESHSPFQSRSQKKTSFRSTTKVSQCASHDSMTMGLKEMQTELRSQKKIQKQKRLDQQQKKQRESKSQQQKKRRNGAIEKQQRIIVKSPNPNDTKVIKIGQYIEQEADVLLNGKIYTDLYKLKPAQDLLDTSILTRTQLLRQKEQVIEKKAFQLRGKHIDAEKAEVKAMFENVILTNQKVEASNQGTEDEMNQKSKVDLQNQLKRLSLDQLQSIHEILSRGGQIVKGNLVPDSNQKVLYLSNFNNQSTGGSPENNKLKIIDYLQNQFDNSNNELQNQNLKRQNSSKQSYTAAQPMHARFQGGERSSGLTQKGSISPKHYQLTDQVLSDQFPGLLSLQKQKMKEDSRDKNHTDLTIIAMQLDDQTDKQTVYLNKKRAEGNTTFDYSRMSQFKGQPQALLQAQDIRESFGVIQQDHSAVVKPNKAHLGDIAARQDCLTPNLKRENHQGPTSIEESSHRDPKRRLDSFDPSEINTNRLSENDQNFTFQKNTKISTKIPSPKDELVKKFFQEKGKKFNEDLNISNVDISRNEGNNSTNNSQLVTHSALDNLALVPQQNTLYLKQKPKNKSPINPQIEVLKSFTPSQQSPHSQIRHYDKVQQPTALVNISKKSQPLVDTSSITYDNTLFFNQQAGLRNSQIQLALQYSKDNNHSSINNTSTPYKNQTASASCTQRVGKKKLVHSDLAQYELYMQLQQMKHLGEEMAQKSILGENSTFDQTKAIGLKKSRQKNTFFGSVSKKLGEVFSPKQKSTIPTIAASTPYLTVPISGQVNLMQRDFDSAATPCTLQNISQGGLQSRASGATPYIIRDDNSGPQSKSGTDHSKSGFYQQTFDPASRMIQQQRFIKNMEKLAKTKVKVQVVTPTGAYGQISESFKLGKPPINSRNSKEDKGVSPAFTGEGVSLHKKTGGSATPNIITNPGTYRTNNQLLNKSSQNVLSGGDTPIGTCRDLIQNNNALSENDKNQNGNRRSSVKILINKNNSQSSKKRLDIDDILENFGQNQEFNVISDGFLSPISQNTMQPGKKAVRLKNNFQNRYNKQATSPDSVFTSFRNTEITAAQLNSSGIISSKEKEKDNFNKTMLYSVKNHQLYQRSKKLKNKTVVISPKLEGRPSIFYGNNKVEEIVRNHLNQHNLFNKSATSYQNARRIMTADNAGLGGSLARKNYRKQHPGISQSFVNSDVLSLDKSRITDFKYDKRGKIADLI